MCNSTVARRSRG